MAAIAVAPAELHEIVTQLVHEQFTVSVIADPDGITVSERPKAEGMDQGRCSSSAAMAAPDGSPGGNHDGRSCSVCLLC